MKLTLLGFVLCFALSKLFAQSHILVAVQQYPDSVAIVNLDDDSILAQLPTEFMPHEICFDPVSKLCYISDFGVEDYDTRSGKPGNSITILDPYQRKIVGKIFTSYDHSANCPHGIKIRPGAKRELFSNIEMGDSLLVFDPVSHQRLRAFPVPRLLHNFIFSPDGNKLWAFAGPGGVYQLDPDKGNLLNHQQLSSPIRGLALLNGNVLASGKNELFVLSSEDLSVQRHFTDLGVGQILYSAVTNDGKYIIAPAAFDGVVLIVDAESGMVVRRLSTGKAAVNIQVTDHDAYISQAEDNHITRIDLTNFKVYDNIKLRGTNGILVLPAK